MGPSPLVPPKESSTQAQVGSETGDHLWMGFVLPRTTKKWGGVASVPHPLNFWKHSRDILLSWATPTDSAIKTRSQAAPWDLAGQGTTVETVSPYSSGWPLLLGILQALPGKKPVAKRAAAPSVPRMGLPARLVALCHAAPCREQHTALRSRGPQAGQTSRDQPE